MPPLTSSPAPDVGLEKRSAEFFRERQHEFHKRTDRLFARLMVLQWLAGIVAAVWLSPLAWAGAESWAHLHLWAAVLVGGAITSLPVVLAWRQPGRAPTRHAIAIGQMLTSALLIHLTGGRIETHFHVFGSLAFLAFYRDWRVLMSATVVVALDHFTRGVFWPQSVFGVLAASPWRWVEHAGWVVFEDVFLLISIRQSLQESHLVAERQANLELLNQQIEQRVAERTRELELEVHERKQTEAKLERTHAQLLETSRQAGMAEVATSVLHNVGNILNSVNVSTTLAADLVKNSRAACLADVSALLQKHHADPAFLATDPRGRQIPAFLSALHEHLEGERATLGTELDQLQKNVGHIKHIVAMQQSYARVSGVTEQVPVSDLVEDALRMNASALDRHEVQTVRDFQDVPPITVEKHKVLQILVNLIRNAKYACDENGRTDKQITLRVAGDQDRVSITVLDNGVGIPPENLERIFHHGFTTKKDGHGFGLHSGALTARELGGRLAAHSEGPGRGATFTLDLPLQPPRKLAP